MRWQLDPIRSAPQREHDRSAESDRRPGHRRLPRAGLGGAQRVRRVSGVGAGYCAITWPRRPLKSVFMLA